MRFNTRLVLTFIAIMVMPLFLSVAVYMIILSDEFKTLEIGQVIVAFVIILALTAALLLVWLKRSFFNPASELRDAMERIVQGNFEEPISIKDKGEIGKIYRDFETMRLTLKATAEQRDESERVARELVSNISHDLKTPITSIKGYVEGIMDGVADSPEKMDRYIHTIYNKANDMDRLIDELAMYSRIGTDQVPYQFRDINVTDYFSDCAEEIGLDLEARGIEFVYVNNVDKSTEIFADPEQLKRVINNVISNSIKYCNEKGAKISIILEDKDSEILVRLEDNGMGIAEEDLPRLFERFYRTDKSRNSQKGGSGIGLSIAKKIIDDHEGIIWAESKLGEGLAISFTLTKLEQAEELEIVPEESNIQKLEKALAENAKKVRDETGKRIQEMGKRYKESRKEVDKNDQNPNS